eukprot:scaffold422691_cov94-Attheya_sp.AAC.1
MDGKTYHWCPHHVMDGEYDGLYVLHPPSKHPEWEIAKQQKKAEKKAQWEARNGKSKVASETPKAETKSEKLVLTDNLRAALTTNYNLSPEQISELLDSQSSN